MKEHYSKQAKAFSEAIHRALDEAMKHKPKSYKGYRLHGFIQLEVRAWQQKRIQHKP